MTMDSPEGISAAPVGDDLFNWSAIMLGPAGTALEGGVWKLDLTFPAEYPEAPPTVRFRTSTFHPNVFPNGQICLDLLNAQSWSPAYDVSTLLVSILSLLANPDVHATPEGAANPEAETLYVHDRRRYNERIEAMVAAQLDEDDADMGCLSAVP
eukprot:CAMPEP_0169285714 /NCGR_PEP_ID=MMETSP1016-20121227/58862_1 /TAXON_ID=342587 /ORGANISM="Karlodinium micrum, Strain CCMP2283" /LENGTH=153 /DNA_ID=CAMNT_0009375273 /DNA_START=49 /DNA_END=510 /DNA_ORIENTATION=+